MEPVSFKPAQQHRLEALLQIVFESRGQAFDPAGRQADIRNIAEIYQREGGDFWVVASGDTLIATIALKIIDRAAGIGEIKRYFVLPDLQGQGIGTQLMDHAIAAARARQLRTLRLDTMKNALAALSIFRKKGFYEIEKYNANEVAEIFMEKTL
jgi:putative acetyltransferase